MISLPVELPGWVIAVATFATSIFAFIAVAAMAEALHVVRHQRRIDKELTRLKLRSRGGLADAVNPLLRDGPGKGPTWLQPILNRLPRVDDFANLLEQADSRMTVGAFLLFSIGCATSFALALTTLGSGPLVVGVGTSVGLLIPFFLINRQRKKRILAFEEHFPNAIDLLSRAIRAGHALSTGLDMVAEEAAEPVAGEFRQVFEEQKYGLPLEESLVAMTDRIALPDVRIFATAITIQRDVGGNLAEILDKLSDVIRERFSFRRQLRTYTAQGRLTGVILALAPIVAGVGMLMLNPEYMSPMLVEPAGRLMLVAAAGLQLIGFVAIRRITDIDY